MSRLKVTDLRDRTSVDEIELEIIDKEEPRDFQSQSGSSGQVCNATGKDDTGEVTVTLWNEEIDLVDVGETIRITNGWAKEYQGEIELSAGKYGELEVVD